MYIMCGFYNAKLNLEQLESLSRGVNVTIMTIRLTLLKWLAWYLGEIKIRHYLVCYQSKRIMKLTYVLTSFIYNSIKHQKYLRLTDLDLCSIILWYRSIMMVVLISYVLSAQSLIINIYSGRLKIQKIRPSCIIVSLANNVLF